MKTGKTKQPSSICRRFSGAFKALVAAVAIAFTGAAWAYTDSEVVNGLRWYFEVVDGSATIYKGEHQPAVEAVSGSLPRSITVPSTLGGGAVWRIGNGTFWNLQNVTNVVLPSSVTSISDYAFYQCLSLSKVNIPAGVTDIGKHAFQFCYELPSLSLPSGLTEIGEYAFAQCRKFSSVTVPSRVATLNQYTFWECTNLTTVTLPYDMTTIGANAFKGCTKLTEARVPARFRSNTFQSNTFPNSPSSLKVRYCGYETYDSRKWYWWITMEGNGVLPVTLININGSAAVSSAPNGGTLKVPAYLGSNPVREIGRNAFRNLNMAQIEYPSTVTNIAAEAIEYAYGLKSFTISNSVTSVGNYAFYYCTNLESIVFAPTSKVPRIGNYAFKKCKLSKVTLPDSVTAIGTYAFQDCANLKKADVPDALDGKITESNVFSGVNSSFQLIYRYKQSTLTWYYKVTSDGAVIYSGESNVAAVSPSTFSSYTVPSQINGHKVVSCGSYAFNNCQNMTSVTIPEGVKDIDGNYVFDGCGKLTTVKLPSTLERIGWGAFRNCTSLKAVTIPEGVEGVGNYAFDGCSNLSKVTMPLSLKSQSNMTTSNVFRGCSSSLTFVYSATATIDGRTMRVLLDGTKAKIGGGTATAPAIVSGSTTGSLTIPSSITIDSTSYTVTEISDQAFSRTGITSLKVPTTLTRIGGCAFYGCSSLSTVSGILDCTNLETIDWQAFSYCPKISSLSFPRKLNKLGDWAFDGCSGLSSVTFNSPDSGTGLTTIPQYVFRDCTNLTTVTLPYEVETINATAFEGCTKLKQIYLPIVFYDNFSTLKSSIFPDCPSTLTFSFCGKTTAQSTTWYYVAHKIKNSTYYDSYTELRRLGSYVRPAMLPKATGSISTPYELSTGHGTFPIHGIGQYAFYNCDVTAVGCGSPVTNIGYAAFENCSKLTSFTMPNSVEGIGQYAFLNCSNLTSVTISTALKKIPSFAFNNCVKLAMVTIPDSVTQIDAKAFRNCTALWKVNMPRAMLNKMISGTVKEKDIFVGCHDNMYIFYGNDTPSTQVFCQLVSPGNTGEVYAWYAEDYSGDDDSVSLLKTARPVNPEPTIGDMEVPPTICTIKVRDLGYGFRNMKTLKTMWLPSSVKNISESAFDSCSNLTAVTYSTGGPTNIQRFAFRYCTSLKTVPFYNTIENIGWSSFNGCTSLTSVTIPASMKKIDGYAFYNCTNLGTLTFASGSKLTRINQDAFNGCTKLASAVIPSSVTHVGDRAFYYCTSLASITFPATLTEIREMVCYNCTKLKSVSIPSSVQTIGEAAFRASGITSLSIAKGVKTIGSTAFTSCRYLEEVIVPDGVESIGASAFSSCSSLLYAELPGSLYGKLDASTFQLCSDKLRVVYRMGENTFAEKIGDYNWCYQLEGGKAKICYPDYDEAATDPKPTGKLVIPQSINGIPVTVVGYRAFANCTDLTEVVIPEGVTTIEQAAFLGCSKLESVSLPESLKIIYGDAFHSCTKLKNIALPAGLEQLWTGAFLNCTSLQQITIPGGVKEIGGSVSGVLGGSVFQGCTALTDVVIQEGVESIGPSSFKGCTSLKNVTIPSTVTTIGKDAFKDCPLEVVNVPTGKSDAIAALLTASGFTVTPGLIKEPDPGKWTITFVPQGGVCTPTSMQVTKGASLEELPTMMKDKFGYKFVGWFTEAEGGTEISAATVPTADATYYAHWSQTIFTVTFDANGGSPASSTLKRGENATLGELPAPILVGYTLVGWFTEKEGGTKVSADTVVTADITYYAHWEEEPEPPPSTYTVTFDANGGSPATSQRTLAANAKLGELPTPILVDYTLVGWFTDKTGGTKISADTVVTADVTYYAHWEKNSEPPPLTYTVTFDANGGSPATSQRTLAANATLGELPTPILVDYTLVGWFTEKTGGTKISANTIVTADVIYYAHWEKAPTPPEPGDTVFTVQFNPNDGTCEEPPRKCKAGEAVGALPDATRSGWTFDGWFTAAEGGEQVTAATLVTADVTFYAHWTAAPTPPDPSGDIVVDAEYGTFIPGVFYSETIDGAAGCTVKGLPTGMKWTAKDTTDSKTKKAIRANSFYGVPTKPGTFTVTFSKKGKESKTAKFTVRNMPNLTFKMSGSGTGSVPAGKSYQAGKSVSVKATAQKGSVFQGWYEGDKLLSEAASYKFIMGMYDTELTAVFRNADDDADAVAAVLVTDTDTGDEEVLDRSTPVQVQITCGVKVVWPLNVAYELSPELSSEGSKVAVSGLPTGLKFTAKNIMKKGSKTEVEIPANTIYGTPTKSGGKSVKITVTTPRKTKVIYNVDVVVHQIDRWAIGPYEGYGWKEPLDGVVSITVAENGKISGKFQIDGKTWTLSAAGFDDLSYDYDEVAGKWMGTYTATVTCKSGKETFTEEMFIDEPRDDQRMGYPYVTLSGLYQMDLWQTFWKFPQFSEAAKAAQKFKEFSYKPSGWGDFDSVTLKFGANGTIKTSGVFGTYKASGSAVLIPMELPQGSLTGPYEAFVFVYFPPKVGKFIGYFEQVTLRWTGTGFVQD